MSTKTIQVNKDYLTHTGKSTIKKDKSLRKKHQSSRTISSPNKLKKEFFKKIKDFQKKKENNIKPIEKTPDEQDFEIEFNKSLMFLQNVADNQKKSLTPSKDIEISFGLPKELMEENTIKPSIVVDDITSSNEIVNKPTITLAPRPPYSSLKNSIHPTYREWAKTQKAPQSVKIQQVVIDDMPSPSESLRAAKLESYKKEINADTIKTKKMTKTIKRTLGKTGRIVSVLIKSRQTRKKIQCEQSKLNQTSIHEVKKYLKSRNFIKTGSNSPNDVLRKLYEQCILAGDITNKSDNILLHNFVND